MADLIDRDAAIALADRLKDDLLAVRNRIIALPSEQPERKKGEWVWNENGMDWGLGAWCCSECGMKPETWWESSERNNPLRCAGGRFCGNCGAYMRGVRCMQN